MTSARTLVLTLALLATGFVEAVGQVNDFCNGALLVGFPSFTAGSNAGAGTQYYLEACGIGADVWYQFVAPYTGTGEVGTCSFLGGSATFDTVITVWVWPGWPGPLPCSGGPPITCNDDYCPPRSFVSFPITAGATYFVAVGGWAGATGSFTLAITGFPANPPNDGCSTALPIAVNATESGENAGANTGSPVPTCGQMGRDVWYSFVAPACGPYVVSTCYAPTNFDTVVAVWQGSCGALSQIACNDDNCASLSSQVTFNGMVGTTYYISLGGFQGAFGQYTLGLGGPTSSPMTLAFSSNGPGTLAFTVASGPTNGTAFTAVTANPGGYPNGWFHGIDITIPDLVAQWLAGYPFLAPLGGACSSVTIGPFGGLPSGLTVYGVSLGLPFGSFLPSMNSLPATGMVP